MGSLMTFDESKWVWMDGQVIPWRDATTHVSAHALHYGSGVFEGMRCYETTDGLAVFRLDAHLDRLYASAQIDGIAIGYTHELQNEAVRVGISRHVFTTSHVG